MEHVETKTKPPVDLFACPLRIDEARRCIQDRRNCRMYDYLSPSSNILKLNLQLCIEQLNLYIKIYH